MAKCYIDQEALFQALTDKFKARLGSSHLPTWNDAFDTAKSIPAADVVEVRHGKWNEVEHGENSVLCECSICKKWMLFYYGFDANFCPSCGADMR